MDSDRTQRLLHLGVPEGPYRDTRRASYQPAICLEIAYRVAVAPLGLALVSRGAEPLGTMNPVAGQWVLESSGQEVGPPSTNHTKALDFMMGHLLPDRAAILKKKHDAGADAIMTRLIYIALLARVRKITADRATKPPVTFAEHS